MTETYIFVPHNEKDIPLFLRMFQSLFYRNRKKVTVYSNRNNEYFDVARRISNWIECSFHFNFDLNPNGIDNFCKKHLYKDGDINILVVSIPVAKLIIKSIDPECIFDLPQENTIVRLKDIIIENKPKKNKIVKN